MKTVWLLLISWVLCGSAGAQQVETVFGSGGPRVRGAYGVAMQKFSAVDGQFANLLGGYGGVLLNGDVLIGAGAFALLNGQSIDIEADTNTSRQLTYVGLMLERTFNSAKAIHFSSGVLAGAAVIGEQNRIPGGGQYTISSRGALVVEPGVQAEVNMTRWFRAAAGVSYRWVAGESKYSAPAATLSLKFGKF